MKEFIPTHIRRQVIKRDRCICQYCGKQGKFTTHYGPRVIEKVKYYKYPYYREIAFEIDHVIPEILGGKTELTNLVLACRSCNRKKGHKYGSGPNAKKSSVNQPKVSKVEI